MKKEITPELIARVALVIIVVIFAGRYGVHKYQEHQRAKELISQGIYELDFSYVAVRNATYVYYMVCDPPETDEEVKAYVDQFLDENNIVPKLMERSKYWVHELEKLQNKSNIPLERISIWFLEPTEDFPAGAEVDDGDVPAGGAMLVVDITEEKDVYQYHYLYLRDNSSYEMPGRTTARETED